MTANLEHIVAESIAGMKFECVLVEHSSRGLLRIVIDRSLDHPEAANGVTIEDCELCSRHLQYVFSVEGVDYRRLEISSPGLDRPLRKKSDFERFLGYPVQVQTKLAIDRYSGRKNFRGILVNVDDQRIILKLNVAEADVSLRNQPGVHPQSKPLLSGNETVSSVSRQKANLSIMTVELQLTEIRGACLIPQIDFRKRKNESRNFIDGKCTG